LKKIERKRGDQGCEWSQKEWIRGGWIRKRLKERGRSRVQSLEKRVTKQKCEWLEESGKMKGEWSGEWEKSKLGV